MVVKVLVVGAGSIGRRHHDNLQTLGAVASLRGWRGYGAAGLRADLRDHDAVVVATATDVRAEVICAAADRGLPVYVEKPLSFSPAEVEAISTCSAPVAERSMVGYMMRWHPAFRELARRDLSDIFRFSFAIGHDVTQWRQNWSFAESYAAQEKGGGVLLDLCHELDMAQCLFPGLQTDEVLSQGHAGYPGVDLASFMTLRQREGGAAGSVAMDYLTPRLHRRAVLHGTRQSFDFDFAAQNYRVQDLAGERVLDLPLERNAMFLDAMRAFLALVAGQSPDPVEHLPRLDRVIASAKLISEAWQNRRFIGLIDKELT